MTGILHPEDVAALTEVIERIVSERAEALPLGSRLLTTQQLAALLGVTRRWVERHIEDLPERIDVCGKPRWREADVERWMRNRPRYSRAR